MDPFSKFSSPSLKAFSLFVVALLLLSTATFLAVEMEDRNDEDRNDDPGDQEPDPLNPDAQGMYPSNFTSNPAGKGTVLTNGSTFMKNVTAGELRKIADLEDEQEFVCAADYDTYRNDVMYSTNGEEDAGAGDQGAEREVEEADIVKVMGDHLYILNPYRGLMVVDLSDPDHPVLAGRAPVFGYPVEMYVVDTLAFVILNTNYNFWYNYWMFWDAALDMMPVYQIGSQILVMNISDVGSPEVIQRIDLEGFISNSRRVGEVIYAVSNCYAWYNTYIEGLENEIRDETYISSINLMDPDNVYEVERVHFPGSSNEIHVTSEAIFIAQPTYRWDTGGSSYWTNVTYVDISDPAGDIVVMDTFTAEGSLSDRYQMDYYSGTFRIVTHFWRGIGESELRIFDVSNPSDITLLGKLLIDDAGSLMATRFQGERGYTIHLPRTVDPLDVLDLSDPRNPKLTDILEMPGWVTHMEIRGYRIIALGVDDSSGTNKVAVSLFDVSDPTEAVLLDRVSIGSGTSWSNANFDPKSLTMLDDEGMVLVPYSARDMRDEKTYRYMNGVQIVDFDLEAGDLEIRGTIEQSDMVTRTRSFGDRILATSTQELQVIDAQDRDNPIITAHLELAIDMLDVLEVGQYALQLVRIEWGQPLLLRTVPLDMPDSGNVLFEMEINADYGRLMVVDGILVFAGYQWSSTDNDRYFVSLFNLSDPLAITELATHPLPSGEYPNLYSYGYGSGWYSWYSYRSQTTLPDDAVNPLVLDDDHLVFHRYAYASYYLTENLDDEPGDHLNYTAGTPRENHTIMILDISNPENPVMAGELSFSAHSAWDLKIREDTLYFTESVNVLEHHEENTSRNLQLSYLGRIDLGDPANPILLPLVNIPGSVIDADAGGSIIYTLSTWWGFGDDVIQTFNTLSLEDDIAILQSAFVVEGMVRGIQIVDSVAYISTSSWTYWGWYWCDFVVMRWHGYDNDPGHTTLMMVDLTTPSDPVLVNSVESSGTGSLLFVRNGFAFIQMDSNSGILIYDVQDIQLPVLVGLHLTQSSVLQIRMYGDHAHMVLGYYGIMTIPLVRTQGQ